MVLISPGSKVQNLPIENGPLPGPDPNIPRPHLNYRPPDGPIIKTTQVTLVQKEFQFHLLVTLTQFQVRRGGVTLRTTIMTTVYYQSPTTPVQKRFEVYLLLTQVYPQVGCRYGPLRATKCILGPLPRSSN